MLNLLTQDLITVTQPDYSQAKRSLPGVLADVMAGTALDFPALRAHHSAPWHTFLVQLAAIATERTGITPPPADEETWRLMLSDLTSDYTSSEPWQLVVTDPMTPAFMQPPVHEPEQFRKYNRTMPTPDSIDLLFPSDNHDVKRFVASTCQPEDWIFALIATQTFNGYGGARTYGVSRMNTGTGNRPVISLAPHDATPADHIKRDLMALLQYLPEIRHNHPRFSDSPDAPSLFWIIPWDGTQEDQLPLDGLHPLYIEVCRRIRLVSVPGKGIVARRATSGKTRVAEAAENRGITGDPWTPVHLDEEEEPKSLTIPAGGFTYGQLARHLFSDEWSKSILTRPTQEEADSQDPMVLRAAALARGQCKTDGYYEREILIRPALKRALRHPEDMLRVQETANDLLQEVSKAKRILAHALRTFNAHGDPKSSGRSTPASNAFLDEFDVLIDRDFFPNLQDILEADGDSEQDEARRRWLADDTLGLVPKARLILEEAINTLSAPTIRRRTAQDNARSLFEARFRAKSGFPKAFENQPADTHLRDIDPPPPDPELPPEGPYYLAPALAGYISQLALHSRSQFAQLRRLDPDDPDCQAFNAIVKRYAIDLEPEGSRTRWGYILRALATMTPSPQNETTNPSNTAHNPWVPLGRVLYTGRNTAKDNPATSPFYSQPRLQALLSARDEPLLEKLTGTLALLSRIGLSVDWRQVIALYISEGIDQETADGVRENIATDYERARRWAEANTRKR